MRYRVAHVTEYDYGSQVSISHHAAHLIPRHHARQTVHSSRLTVDPTPAVRFDEADYFGNILSLFTIQEPHAALRVTVESDVEVLGLQPFSLDISPAWEDVARAVASPTDMSELDAVQFIYESPYVSLPDQAYDYARPSFPQGEPLLSGVMNLTQRIYSDFSYEGGVTDVSTPVDHVLDHRKGVCQDFAHVQIACLRALGLPARYVSGYLRTHPVNGDAKLTGADESHAWVSVWCTGLGWIDFDATNNLIPDQEHVTLSWGRDYGDVSPINGFMIGGGEHSVDVSVDVAPVNPL